MDFSATKQTNQAYKIFHYESIKKKTDGNDFSGFLLSIIRLTSNSYSASKKEGA
jgi:hypothetical protein